MERPIKLKRCSRCLKEKQATADLFAPAKATQDGLFAWCRSCKRIADAEYRRSDAGRLARARYAALPESRRRRREQATRKYWSREREARSAYWRTAKGRYMSCRNNARRRLIVAVNPKTILRLYRRIEDCDRELVRMGVVLRPNARKAI